MLNKLGLAFLLCIPFSYGHISYQCAKKSLFGFAELLGARKCPDKDNFYLCSCHFEEVIKERFKNIFQLASLKNTPQHTALNVSLAKLKDQNPSEQEVLKFIADHKKYDEINYAPNILRDNLSYCVSLKKIEIFLKVANISINDPILKNSTLGAGIKTILDAVTYQVICEQCIYDGQPNFKIIKELIKRGATPNTEFVTDLKKELIENKESYISNGRRDVQGQQKMINTADKVLTLYKKLPTVH